MREIKFRAWDRVRRKMYPVEEITFYKNHTVPVAGGVSDEESPFPIMQYTGYKDANGTEIYEGDIWERNGFKAVVEFKFGGWNFSKHEKSRVLGCPYFHASAVCGVVVGNIFEEKSREEAV